MEKKARVVIIEFHCGLHNDIPLVCKEGEGTVESHEGSSWNNRHKSAENPNWRTLNGYFGENLLAVYRLAKEKGYKIVTTLTDNAIFVLEEEFPKLNIDEINEEKLINNYFSPISYWGEKHRDLYNNEWVIPG